jgi:hypothetical protein
MNEHATDSAMMIMPLIRHFKEGYEMDKPPAWHRNEERRARGLLPVKEEHDNHDEFDMALLLEGWERELLWTEILLLTGNPDASFPHLARAWGRERGFHTLLAQFICEGRGDLNRFSPSKRKIMALHPQIDSMESGNDAKHSETAAKSTTTSKKKTRRMTQQSNPEEYNRRDMCGKIDNSHDSVTVPKKSADILENSCSHEE